MTSEDDRMFLIEGHKRLVAGSRAYGRAVRLISFGDSGENVHRELRGALHTFRGAMNYLEDEDHELFETAHVRLDAAGALARSKFPDGCHLEYKDGGYNQTCPVALAHDRSGLSPGYKIRSSECSICNNDPEDCDHITGRVYDGKRCTQLITDAEVMEVSLVGKPAQPDARITSIGVSAKKLRANLGDAFRPGVPVLCDYCLSPCKGIVSPFKRSQATVTVSEN